MAALEPLFTNIANALRTVNKTSSKIPASGFPDSILKGVPDIVTEIFTQSGSWICPEGVTTARFIMIGGGGGGGFNRTVNGQTMYGSAGNPGSTRNVVYDVTPGAETTITVGTCGTISANGNMTRVIVNGTTTVYVQGGMGGGDYASSTKEEGVKVNPRFNYAGSSGGSEDFGTDGCVAILYRNPN